MKTFVISLKDSQERREYITKHLSNHDLEFEFIDAVDLRNTDISTHEQYDRAKRLKYYGKDLLSSELGCALSHKKILQKIVDEDINIALICEDDLTILDENFSKVIDEFSTCKDKYDMIRFLGDDKIYYEKKRRDFYLFDKYWAVKYYGTPGGAFAYIITKQGAQKLLAKMKRTYMPIDIYYGMSWVHSLKWYTVLPIVSYVNFSLDSSIGTSRFEKENRSKKLSHKINYFCYKIYLACGKFYSYHIQ